MKIYINELYSKKIVGYFRSDIELNYGSIFETSYKERHIRWSEPKKILESFFEFHRQKYYPDKISRYSGVFSSPYFNNRFEQQGGYIYEVQLLGRIHYGDSDIIDRVIDPIYTYIGNNKKYNVYEYIKDSIDKYWQGKLGDKKSIEMLSDKVKILDVIRNELNKKDVIKIKKDLKATIVAGYNKYFIKKNNIKIIDDGKMIHDVILPKGMLLKIAYVPKKYRGAVYKITCIVPNDLSQTEVTIENQSLMDYIEIVKT